MIDFSEFPGLLSDSLTSLSLLIAAAVYICKSALLPLLAITRRGEARKVARLSTALTYARFREVIGREPNAYRDLRGAAERALTGDWKPKQVISYLASRDSGTWLYSRFFVLRHLYVEAFIDPEERVYGYSVSLRRSSSRVKVTVGSLQVTLGRSTLADVWVGMDPDGFAEPIDRNFGIMEVVRPHGYTSERSYAAGHRGAAELEPSVLERAWGSIERVTVKAPALHSTVQRLRPERNVEPIMELLDMLSGCRSGELPPEYFKDPALSLRRRIHINTVAIAHFGDMLPPLVQLHSGELPPTQ